MTYFAHDKSVPSRGVTCGRVVTQWSHHSLGGIISYSWIPSSTHFTNLVNSSIFNVHVDYDPRTAREYLFGVCVCMCAHMYEFWTCVSLCACMCVSVSLCVS